MKQKLLKYLCAALPYGLKVLEARVIIESLDKIERVNDNSDGFVVNRISDEAPGFHYTKVRPFLRPMSSMTEDEIKDLANVLYGANADCVVEARHSCDNSIVMRWREHSGMQTSRIWYDEVRNMKHLDWLLKNHFDFYGLIPANWAVAVTDDDNPYKIA